MSHLKRRARNLCAAVAAVMIASGCGAASGSSSSPGVTDDSILIGSHLPLTGPAAPGLMNLGAAWTAYFDYVNENGGVNGRDIKMKYYDDAYNPATTSQVVRKLVQQDKVFAMLGGVGTPTHSSALDFLTANKVPDMFPSSPGATWNDTKKYPNTFGWQTNGIVEGKIIAGFIKTTFPDAKVCSFGQDGELSTMGVEGYEQVMGKDSYVAQETYTPGDAAITTQILALQSAGCEVVNLHAVTAFAANAVKTANQLGYHPQFVGGYNNSDYATLAGLVGDPALLEGFIAFQFLPSPNDESNSWVAMFKKIWDEHGNGEPFGAFIEYGMTQAYTMTQALLAAGKDLTREGFIDTVNDMTFAPNPGLAPLTYAKDNHSGYAGGKMAQVTNGSLNPIGDVLVTGPDKSDKVKAATEPPSEAPADGLPTDAK